MLAYTSKGIPVGTRRQLPALLLAPASISAFPDRAIHRQRHVRERAHLCGGPVTQRMLPAMHPWSTAWTMVPAAAARKCFRHAGWPHWAERKTAKSQAGA
jgi:hypothetical protein